MIQSSRGCDVPDLARSLDKWIDKEGLPILAVYVFEILMLLTIFSVIFSGMLPLTSTLTHMENARTISH